MATLSNKARELQREYLRAWRANNRDRIRRYNVRYWERQAERQEQEAQNAE